MTAAARAPMVPTPAAELRRGTSSVRVAVTPGAPVTSYCTDGVEWCAAGPWRDYAPTLAACALPTFVAGVSKTVFPEGGLLAETEPEVTVHADGGAGTITARWEPAPYPLAWTRVIALDADGALCASYTVSNEQRTRLPFIWGCQLPMTWSAAAAIDVPKGARSRVSFALGEGLPKVGSEFAWPALRDGGRLADLGRPASLDARREVHCYIELPRARLVIRDGDSALEITGDPAFVTHAHVCVNNDADAAGDPPRRWWRRHHMRRTIVTGLSVGAPALLSEAVGAWRAARWLDAGESVSWIMRYRTLPPAPSTP